MQADRADRRVNPAARGEVFAHPRPAQDQLAQRVAFGLGVVMLGAVGAQVVLAMAGGFPLFLASALITLALAPLAFMQTALAPAVTLHADGLTLHPVIWRERHIPWSAIREVKPNPLLPPENTESVRRAMEGRQHYQPARGLLLVIPTLPLQYRIAGFFAGEGFTGVIALGSRTHTRYDRLLAGVQAHLPDVA